jgi:hypothetical protein
MTRTSGTLFDEGELRVWLDARRSECETELARISEAQVLERPLDQSAASLIDRYELEPIELLVDRKYAVDRGETKVWGPGSLVTQRVRVRMGGDRGSPGRAATVHIPFTGEPDLLFLQPSRFTFGGPQGRVEGSELVFPFEWPSRSPIDIEAATADALRKIEDPYLQAQAEDLARFNTELLALVTESLANRRQRILEAREHLDGLKIPVYRRQDAPKTFAAPGIERRRTPQPASTTPGAPLEPVLVSSFYEHIIDVIGAMARAMERTPGDYATWSEEQLRDSLLVMLNTHYKGQATGETFNKSGKTDVLVRVGDRNVFVDECKWWSGASDFAGVDTEEPSALDQLLSYATWRDAKLALTVFVSNKDIGRTISAARTALEAHPAFLAWSETTEEGQLQCRVRVGEGTADLVAVFVHLPKD